MKNNLRKISVLLGLGLLTVFTSCSRDFLETNPTDKISDSDALGTADNLALIINGMIRDMYVRQNASQGQNGQGGIMIMMDALGEDLVFPTTGNGWYVTTVRWQDQINENGSNDFYPWQFYYALIRNANYVIANGATATGDPSVRDRAIGEAYAFRAFSHYMLVQIYGNRYDPTGSNNAPDGGIPLRVNLETGPIKRNTVDEVYSQVNADLNQALTLLTGKSRAAKSHFDTKVVYGMMARVALTQGRYADAATFAGNARLGYSLMSNADYQAGFNSIGNGEWMWGSEIVADQTDYFGNFGAYMSRNYNSTNIRQNPKAVNKLLYNMFPTTDVRTKVIDPTGQHLSLGLPSTYSKFPYTSQKFLSVSFSDSRCDVPLMRAAEMYLIQAEALARIPGQEAASKVIYNQFALNRNPSYTPTSNTGTAYINEVMASRRIEFWGEGFRFLDLKRLNQAMDRTGTNAVASVINNVFTVPAGDKRWLYLIPRSEINANPLMVQNPL